MTSQAFASKTAGDRTGGLAALVARAQRRDPAAYEELVARFQDMAVGYAHSILGDRHLAQDAAQEAFVEAHAALPSLRDPGAFDGWFRSIVFKHCDRFTRRPRLRVVRLEEAAELPAARDPADLVVEAELRATVRRALVDLPEPERIATTLFYVGDYSQAEIAGFLNLPVTTVNNRLHAARKRLHRSMLDMVREHLHEGRPSKDKAFVAGVVRLIAPDKERDSDRIYETLEEKTVSGRSQWREGRLAHSHFDWGTSRIGLADDRLVSIFGIYDVAMRVGSARVRVAGVNLEYADPEHADETLSERTAAASLAEMVARGYDLSIAFGNEAFYHRLGYVFGWRELMWFIRVGDLPDAPLGLPLEAFEPVHRDDLAALYNAEHETLTGTAVKPTYRQNKHPGTSRGYLWRNRDGSIRGYVVADSAHEWRSPDLGRLNHGGYRSLLWHDESAGGVEERLTVLGGLAREAQCREVAFDRLHRRSPLGRRLWQMRCRIEEEYRSYVVRIVNLSSLFEKLAPELSRRLAASPLAEWSGTLVVSSEGQRVPLRIGPNGIGVEGNGASSRTARAASSGAVEGGREIAQLVVGSDDPDQIVEAAGIRVHGEAARLLPVLFPRQDPQMENQAL